MHRLLHKRAAQVITFCSPSSMSAVIWKSGILTQWLQAYYDGELSGRQLDQVEAHLIECGACQSELDQLSSLSVLLEEAPSAQPPTSPDRFVAQVGLRLPRRPLKPLWQRAFQPVGYLVPLAAFMVMAFISASVWVNNLIAGVTWVLPKDQPLVTALNDLQNVQPDTGIDLPVSLPEYGLSELAGFSWERLGYGGWGLDLTLSVLLPTLLALICLSWVAAWWATQRKNGQNKQAS